MGREKGLVYTVSCESGEEGHIHTYTRQDKFLPWFEILEDQENKWNKFLGHALEENVTPHWFLLHCHQWWTNTMRMTINLT